LGKAEQTMFIVASVFKGTTINKKMRLAHDSLSRPETRILKWFGYVGCVMLTNLFFLLYFLQEY